MGIQHGDENILNYTEYLQIWFVCTDCTIMSIKTSDTPGEKSEAALCGVTRTKHGSRPLSPGQGRAFLGRKVGSWGFSQSGPLPALMAPLRHLRNRLGLLGCFRDKQKKATPSSRLTHLHGLGLESGLRFSGFSHGALSPGNTLQLYTGPCRKFKVCMASLIKVVVPNVSWGSQFWRESSTCH